MEHTLTLVLGSRIITESYHDDAFPDCSCVGDFLAVRMAYLVDWMENDGELPRSEDGEAPFFMVTDNSHTFSTF